MTVRRLSAVCGAIALSWMLAPGVAHAERLPSASTLTLDVVLPENSLPPLSARVMRDEAERIWSREGVHLVWRGSQAETPPGEPFVRVTLLGDEHREERPRETFVLGDFLPEEGRIRLSVGAAARTAHDAVAASRRPGATYVYPLTLGYVLGRALAHEIGHALLGKAHSDSGLMAATFKPTLIGDSQSPSFRLNHGDAARLPGALADARLALHGPPNDAPSDLEVVGVVPTELAR